ncbi:MAG: flagellar protein FlgN [Desulfobacterales bacterium]|jgi:flagellar biosynthesis/type III secretory pathway chaperone
MQDILNRLLALLDTLERVYRSLRGELENERAALTAANLADFLVARDRKEALLNRLQVLEDQRVRQTDQLAAALDLPPATVTVSRLAHHLPPVEAGRLKACGDRLTAILAQVGKLNGVNRALIGASLGFVEGSLRMLQGLRRPASTYHHNGRMRSAPCSGTLLANDY